MFDGKEQIEIFEQNRKRLFGIAYRMLGTHSDAEDIVQEAYLRWHKSAVENIETPEAWLVTVVTRLAIDRLRKLKNERENYIGPWLPEPFIISDAPTPEDKLELASNVSMAFMVLLERLSPVERAAFLLHDIFDCGYAEIARIIGKTETALRQIVTRARTRIRTDKPRFESNETERKNLIEKFAAASYAGDEKTLLALFSDEIMMMSDGGGKVQAARTIVHGKTKLARLFSKAGVKHGASFKNLFYEINGETGLLTFFESEIFAATAFEFEDAKISAIYRVMNPDKLKMFAELVEKDFAL